MMRERPLLHTLRSIWCITDLAEREIFIRHPFVVCAWRFKHLTEVLLSGMVILFLCGVLNSECVALA